MSEPPPGAPAGSPAPSALIGALVVGDAMLDVAVRARQYRRCPDDVTAVVLPADLRAGGADRTVTSSPGGAANLAANLAALAPAAAVTLLARPTADPNGDLLRGHLAAHGVNTSCAGESSGAALGFVGGTTTKVRYFEGDRLVARVDEDHDAPAVLPPCPGGLSGADPLLAAVLVTDYGRGAVTADSLRAWLAWCTRAGVPLYVDPKLGRTHACRKLGGGVVVANWFEACELSGRDPTPAAAADDRWALATARAVLAAAGCAAAVVKRGVHGSAWALSGGEEGLTPPVAPRAVYDVCGAGDTYLAGLAAGRLSGLSWPDATLLASAAAGVAVGVSGTAVVSRRQAVELLKASGLTPCAGGSPGAAAVDAGSVYELAARLKGLGYTVGLASGVFDLFHPGHAALLRHAAPLCDALFVGVDSDERVRQLKGPGRPVVPAAGRAAVAGSVAGVAAAFVFDEHPAEVVAKLRPDVLVKGGDYTAATLPEAALLAQWGGRVEFVPRTDPTSTTALVARVEATRAPACTPGPSSWATPCAAG